MSNETVYPWMQTVSANFGLPDGIEEPERNIHSIKMATDISMHVHLSLLPTNGSRSCQTASRFEWGPIPPDNWFEPEQCSNL